jgi:uncharacterized membrane protein YczE
MENMIIAYVLIAVVLLGYGASLYLRARLAAKAIRAVDENE